MESSEFKLVGNQFDRGAYKSLLNEIIENDKQQALKLIPLLALRSAIRVMPVVATYKHLNFWMQGTEDNRCRYLAVLLGIINLSNGSISASADASDASDVADVAADAAEAADAARAAEAVRAVAYAANAAAYAADVAYAAAAAYAAYATAARESPVIANVFFEALKADVSLGLKDISALQQNPLWVMVPEWFSINVGRLENIIAGLPREGEVEDWQQIDSGIDYLKSQAGLKNDRDANAATIKPNSEREHLTIISFEANNQSHPEIPAKADKLNRQKLVNALAANLVNPANSHHRAIGLLGEWGSGKSTVLDLLKQRLKELNAEQPYIFGEFNAWAYEHTDNIQAGVAQEMINALAGSPNFHQPLYAPTATFFEKFKVILSSDVRNIFSSICNAIPVFPKVSLGRFGERCLLTIRFAYKVHPIELLKILLLLLVAAMPWFSEWFQGLIEFSESSSNKSSWIWTGGVFLYTLREFGKLIISPQARELLTYLRLPSYAEHLGTIPVMRKHICTLCELRLEEKNGTTPRLLFVVDDLDRCSPSAIVKVLEAVRLVLDLDNVIVIIAIDQHIALAALSEHFKDFSSHHKLKNSHAIAREYLSKVINLPIVLTKPSGDDVRVFMGSFWDEMNKEVDQEINENKSKIKTIDIPDISKSSGATTTSNDRIDGRNMPPHASSTSDNVQSVLNEVNDPDDSVQAIEEVEPPPTIKPVKALSKDQQESFIHWVNYFELSNSRQLKRLNNSYDLMRSYVPLMDKEVSEFEFAESSVSKVYPMLLTLILMEYLNSLHDLKERNQLWNQLFRESTDALGEVVGNKLISAGFVKAYRGLLASEANQSLVSNVEAFVLPAMT